MPIYLSLPQKHVIIKKRKQYHENFGMLFISTEQKKFELELTENLFPYVDNVPEEVSAPTFDSSESRLQLIHRSGNLPFPAPAPTHLPPTPTWCNP